MKQILKIKNITDVITNSSSEVFIMTQESAKEKLPITEGEGFIIPLNEKWFNDRTTDEHYVSHCPINEWELICQVLGIEKKRFGRYVKDYCWGYYELNNDGKDWINYLDTHKEEILNKLKGYVIFETEDHFEDAWEHIERWRIDAKAWDSRH